MRKRKKVGDIMEFKKELLKGTVVARGYSMQDVAEWLDINLSTLYRKNITKW